MSPSDSPNSKPPAGRRRLIFCAQNAYVQRDKWRQPFALLNEVETQHGETSSVVKPGAGRQARRRPGSIPSNRRPLGSSGWTDDTRNRQGKFYSCVMSIGKVRRLGNRVASHWNRSKRTRNLLLAPGARGTAAHRMRRSGQAALSRSHPYGRLGSCSVAALRKKAPNPL
jgi:hypothetical protein